ncbi:sigma-54-dependent transcriptional regulator [Desulfovibrio inopinatus]|uniref:sigma-54-dependent transcriptional regulator n=1 Tax=Desulfovibrio inopinatus TaxID=102109 RepID=UPI000409D80E|nr:sigma-54 dependent transcriptional regulator [Desulfovibrio inopinatus]
MAQPIHILVVEDETVTRENLQLVLKREGYDVDVAPDGESALKLLKKNEYDVVLTDMRMRLVDGVQVLNTAKALQPDTEVIVLTGYATVEMAVQAMEHGAYYYLSKPYNLDELRALIRKALEKNAMSRELKALRQHNAELSMPLIVGQSKAVTALRELVAQIAPVDSNVLILGETGTGKELVARAIHHLSPRNNERFLAINCAGFAENLLENELFGHEKEAFSGASSTKKGLLEQAHGGTFFLDEIGDMPLPMQAKFLRTLETKTLIRLGGSEEINVDVRFVAATNKDLLQAVEDGEFRRDLYYRLNVVSVQTPPLEDRREDIELLARHFLHKHAHAMGKNTTDMAPEVVRILCQYEFPGNVRELENIIESALVMCTGEMLQPKHLPLDLQQQTHWFNRVSREEEPITLQENEKRYIAWVLEQTQGNKTQAAQILGIDRASLWRKLKRLEMDNPSDAPQ